MMEFFAELVPQLFLLFLIGGRAYGSAIAETGAKDVAKFMEAGGNDPEPVKIGSEALSKAVLSISTYLTTVLVVLLDSIFAIILNEKYYLFFLSISVFCIASVCLFLSLTLGRKSYELALNRGERFVPTEKRGRFSKSTSVDILNLNTITLVLLSIAMGILKTV